MLVVPEHISNKTKKKKKKKQTKKKKNQEAHGPHRSPE
jgi:hypothetical protein